MTATPVAKPSPNGQAHGRIGRHLDAEVVVSAVLLFGRPIARKYADRINPAHFTDPLRVAIVKRSLDAIRNHGEVVFQIIGDQLINLDGFDPGTVEAELNHPWLLDAAEFDGEDQFTQALKIVTERAQQFEYVDACREIVNMTGSNGLSLPHMTAGEMREHFEAIGARQASEQIARLSTLADTLDTDPADDQDEFVPTGIAWFDSAMPGGALCRTDKFVVAGPPGTGKTALCLQLTLGALTANPEMRAICATGEMVGKKLRNRALACLSGLTPELITRPYSDLSPLQATGKQNAIDKLRDIGQRLHIVKAPLTPSAIETAILTTHARWVMIDYLQLCCPDKAGSSRRDDIDAVLRELVRIAQAHGVVLMIVSNMPKGSERGRDIFSAFKESSEIAFAADLAYVMEPIGDEHDQSGDHPDEGGVRLRCLKARNGPKRSINTRFLRWCQKFEGDTS